MKGSVKFGQSYNIYACMYTSYNTGLLGVCYSFTYSDQHWRSDNKCSAAASGALHEQLLNYFTGYKDLQECMDETEIGQRKREKNSIRPQDLQMQIRKCLVEVLHTRSSPPGEMNLFFKA